MEDRHTPRIDKHGEITKDSNCEGKHTSLDFRRRTYEIAGLLTFAGQRVHYFHRRPKIKT